MAQADYEPATPTYTDDEDYLLCSGGYAQTRLAPVRIEADDA